MCFEGQEFGFKWLILSLLINRLNIDLGQLLGVSGTTWKFKGYVQFVFYYYYYYYYAGTNQARIVY